MNQVHNRLTAALRLFGLILWFLILSPVLITFRLLRLQRAVMRTSRLIYLGVAKIIGLSIEVYGTPCLDHPVLYVANHSSYLDIVVLGARLDAFFVAKNEVKSWPVLGPLASVAGTVFIERRARHSKTQSDQMSDRLKLPHNSLILFPEGTSSNGQGVLPFKSSLFSVAESIGRALPVQPISLAYTMLDGMPLGRGWRSFFTWYGDMELAPHLWMALGLGRPTVTVMFHPPVTLQPGMSRKKLAGLCEQQVRSGVVAANRGRAADYGAALT